VQLRSLLLSNNERVSTILSRLLHDLGIEVHLCSRIKEAREKLSDRKYDGIFADFEHPDALDLIRSVKKYKHNKRSVAFAIVEKDAGLQQPFQAGAHFVIHKPLSIEGSKRTLRAAHGLLMREKRNHFRNDISASGALSANGRASSPILLLDLHRTGALIESPVTLKQGQKVNLWFSVPESTVDVRVEAIVRWTDIVGRAGVEFQTIAENSQRTLEEWARRMSTEFDDIDEMMANNPGITCQFERVRSVALR
jgi:CheY-like chemotaxis protein